MPKGYLIAHIKVNDKGVFCAYQKAARMIMQANAGHMKPLVVAHETELRESANGVAKGSSTIVLEFDSFDRAKAFYDSEDYQNAIKLREFCADSTFILAPGKGEE